MANRAGSRIHAPVLSWCDSETDFCIVGVGTNEVDGSYWVSNSRDGNAGTSVAAESTSPHPWIGGRPIRLAVLFTHPIQYFAPLMRELNRRPDVNLTVYYCSQHGLVDSYDPGFGTTLSWDIPLLDGYPSDFVPNLRGSTVGGFFSLINPGIVARLARGRHDAIVVHGYEHLTKWLVFASAPMVGTRLILRGESHLLNPRRWQVRLAKRLLLGPLFRGVASCAYIGENNRRYFRHYGVEPERLVFTPYAVDNQYFQTQRREIEPRRQSIRESLGVTGDTPIILACGKLITRKQPLELLRAFQRVRQATLCSLVFAGDGDLRDEIERIVRADSIPDVRITGFVNQSRIGELYLAADLLALPSASEPWGLVVNEAMNFGLPVLVSDQVGCAPDLVSNEENGLIVPNGDTDALSRAIGRLVSNATLRRSMGQRSLEIIQNYSLERCADGLVEAARVAMR